MKEQISARASN